jgi:hypothetical protein
MDRAILCLMAIVGLRVLEAHRLDAVRGTAEKRRQAVKETAAKPRGTGGGLPLDARGAQTHYGAELGRQSTGKQLPVGSRHSRAARLPTGSGSAITNPMSMVATGA